MTHPDENPNEPTIRRILNQAWPMCGTTLQPRAAEILAKVVAELRHGDRTMAELYAQSDFQTKQIWDNATRTAGA